MCDTPFYKQPDGYLRKIPLPCGKCPVCKTKRVNQWAFRLMQEEKVSSSAYFVTLTYSTDNVPISKNGYMTLVKKDVQDFMKRLRKKEQNKLKYYCAGEYGETRMRPHYHMILFNLSDKETILPAWQHGDVHFGTVTGASVAYTAKYIDKDKRIPLHGRDDRIPEFSLMSKGLGASYLTPGVIAYHKADLTRCFVKEPTGYAVALPRYYRKRIYDEHEQEEQIKLISQMKARERAEKALKVLRQSKGRLDIATYEESARQQRYIIFQKRKNLKR